MRNPFKWTAAVAAALIVGVLLLAAFFDWNHLREPISRLASERAGRTVRIGTLQAHLLSATPELTVTKLKVANPGWAGGGDMVDVKRATVAIKLLPLLKGEVVVPLVTVDDPKLFLYSDEQGRANWQLESRKKPARQEEATDLPVVRHFTVRGGDLKIIDRKRKLAFEGTVAASESTSSRDSQPFALHGRGELNGRPFRLEFEGAPLVNVDRDKPYHFSSVMTAGDIRMTGRGKIQRPFDFGAYSATLSITGHDLADLYYLTGLALPNTPPYRLSGSLVREQTRFRLTNLSGRVGDSDMRGNLTVDLANARPRLTGDLTSRQLDLDDLAAPLGASPSIREGETTSPEQKKLAAALAAKRRLFPDSPLDVTRVRAMDADVKFRAEAIEARKVPLRELATHIRLDAGVLRLDPLSFILPQGKVAGTVRIDARNEPPVSDIDLRITSVRLDQFKPKNAEQPPIEGLLLGRAKLRGVGNSVHKVASTAEGTVSIVVPHGEVREAFAELTGINVMRGLGLLLTKDQQQTPVRCDVAEFRARNGTLRAENLVFDTKDVLITGKGSIYLGDEAFDLEIKGQPKKLRLMRVRTPILIRGPLRKPSVGLEADEGAAQTGIAAALGALVTPLAAVIAFVDPGLAENADCAALLAEADRKGAPLRTATSRKETETRR